MNEGDARRIAQALIGPSSGDMERLLPAAWEIRPLIGFMYLLEIEKALCGRNKRVLPGPWRPILHDHLHGMCECDALHARDWLRSRISAAPENIDSRSVIGLRHCVRCTAAPLRASSYIILRPPVPSPAS